LNYSSNPLLKTIKPGWAGTPLDQHNRFVNLGHPFLPKLSEVLKWKLSRNPQKEEKELDTFRPALIEDKGFLSHDRDCIIWLGHATFLVRLNHVNLLIDPVFFDVPLIKRYTKHAYSPTIFNYLHYLLISHDHQDHCQKKSIQQLATQNPRMKILTGLNMEKLLRPWCKNISIEMAGWYQRYETVSDISISFLPTRHWSKRGLSDENERLWGAFVLQSKHKTIYFGGDTGYDDHFKETKELFPKINVAMIGIGAYKPEWFMHPNHVSPKDAVKGFNDLGAEVFIPMHYGTFDISDEPVGEPLRIVQQLERENKIQGKLKVLGLGESFEDF
jgi:L-ascorbate metabolism protein UlaG (beta-lactamase superfamily)